MSSKTILKGIIHVGGFTLLSRVFGIIRELLMVNYLGVSGLSDAFLTAYKIPNSLRKVFAEGALSAAFVPRIVTIIKHQGTSAVSGLMLLGFVLFEGFVFVVCAVVMIYASEVLYFVAPGFSVEQVASAVPILRIVMPFIFFISSSALLAGALQAIGHFFVPAFSQIVINSVVIAGLVLCNFFSLPVTSFCWFILAGGLVQFLLHLAAYFVYNFNFALPTRDDWQKIIGIFGAFIVCLPSVSIMEIALFIDTSFASYLKPGSLSLLYYANRFVGIPLGVFAVTFSTILLPHLSRIHIYSSKRLHFYLFESAKLIAWVTIPVTFLLCFFSYDIFSTIFASKFTAAQMVEASDILVVTSIGLFFFSLNKVLLNVFYAMRVAWVPALISLGTTALNIILNMLLLTSFQAIGLACATTIAAFFQSCLLLLVLHYYYDFRLYMPSFCLFVMRYGMQMCSMGIPFVCLYYGISNGIAYCMPEPLALFFLVKIGLWMWVGPLSLLFMIFLWYFRSLFTVKLYFLR